MDKLRVQIPICTDHFKPGIYRMAIGYSAGQSIEDSAHKRGWDITVPTGHYLPDALPGTYPYAVISNDITIQILPRPSMGTPASLPATIPATRAATLPANDYFREQKDRMINVLESDAWYFAVGNIENSVKGNHSPDWHYYVFSNMNYIHFFNSDYSWRAKGEWKIESNPSGTLTLFLKGNDQGGGGLLPESYIDYDPNTDKIVVWGDHYVRPKILSRCYPDPKYPDAFPSLTKPATQPATQP
jgi:hypothetical protein